MENAIKITKNLYFPFVERRRKIITNCLTRSHTSSVIVLKMKCSSGQNTALLSAVERSAFKQFLNIKPWWKKRYKIGFSMRYILCIYVLLLLIRCRFSQPVLKMHRCSKSHKSKALCIENAGNERVNGSFGAAESFTS